MVQNCKFNSAKATTRAQKFAFVTKTIRLNFKPTDNWASDSRKSPKPAKYMKKDGFKASNSWLNRFRTQHNISQAVVCRESGCVDKEVVQSWKSRLPGITAGYAACGIYNMDKSGFFFRVLPYKLLEKKELNVKEGKDRTNRLRPCSA